MIQNTIHIMPVSNMFSHSRSITLIMLRVNPEAELQGNLLDYIFIEVLINKQNQNDKP